MGDRFTDRLVITRLSNSFVQMRSIAATAIHVLPEFREFLIDLFPKGHNTPLSPSHAGDKGDFDHGLRPVDMVVLPRPSVKEEGKAAVSVPSKKGRLYLEFIVAAAIVAAASEEVEV